MEMREIDERDKLQFDYAWKWFESHQRQRMISVDTRIGMREGQKLTAKRLLLKHKYWIRVMYVIVAFYFLFMVIGALAN